MTVKKERKRKAGNQTKGQHCHYIVITAIARERIMVNR
jgi:hypothetical protein